MIVANVMKRNPLYVNPNTSVNEASALMKKEGVSKLPVLDKHDKLVGLITKKDLDRAAPSSATSLDVYEISYLLSKLKVEQVMEKKVFTVEQSEVVEEAARIMADETVSCLPVMKGDLLVGIVTVKDLFYVFIDMFGARHEGVRVTATLDEKPGQLARLSAHLTTMGGNIVSLATFEGDSLGQRRITCKISGLSCEHVKKAIELSCIKVEDIR
ncbi:MAG TPA: CBS and ACT domain-containing protein [Treponemataceae bacterium]|nr:CBS and ACT domain-containing protein [Treponemataceae bacterium]